MYTILGANQKEYGPATAEEVQRWLLEQRVRGDTMVRKEGSAGWQRLASLPEFASALAGIPLTFPTSSPIPLEQRTNSMATSGLVMSCIGLICCGGCLPIAVLGVVFSIIGLNEANRDPAQVGKGVAIAGLVIGLISLLGAIAATVATVMLGIVGGLMEALQR
jgi:hypothetical protein